MQEMEFKEKVLQAQEHILDLSEHPAQATAIASTIGVNIATLHLKAREFKIGIGKDIYKVEIKAEVGKP